MNRRRVAIACQGGGSQCAFVAGALRALLTEQVDQDYEIIGFSGTSGGALTAAVAWFGLLRQAQGDSTPPAERILAFWNDLSAQTPIEVAFDQFCIQLLRLTERGLVPSIATSPSSTAFKLWSRSASLLLGRPEFTDLRAIIAKHLDCEALSELQKPGAPLLLVGACDILEGRFKVFSSAYGEIQMEALLASAAIPNLFPAVEVDGHAYWDGIFSSNPPVIAFLQKTMAGIAPPPEEIWIIQVNRAQHETIPELPSDIFDRRNHLAGNLSLQHELQIIELVNFLLREGALTDRFRSRFGLDTHEEIAVRFIRMSPELQRGLDYPSKLSRQPTHISKLIADGELQARAFLEDLRRANGAEAGKEEALVGSLA